MENIKLITVFKNLYFLIMNIHFYLEMSPFVVEMTEECEKLFRVFIQIEII